MDLQSLKQRFGIIGNSFKLNQGIHVAMQVSPTDLSVLITGESGTGKEIFSQIIHNLSSRKHGNYIAVNCGAIPEGTIDSELFGHEKGSFTGAHDSRKGYFEVADKGTIFLDEVAELPLSTQVRLLRVLETGEFFKVGSSKAIKTDVRVVAATNVNVLEAIHHGKFREDLYYRLNTVPILIPPLRERGEDIHLLFRKFAVDFAEKYQMPGIRLNDDAVQMLLNYRWPGNVRQLKNVTEQISIIEKEKQITGDTFKKYLPDYNASKLPALYKSEESVDQKTFATEREILYKILFDMKNDMTELKKTVRELMINQGKASNFIKDESQVIEQVYEEKIYTATPEIHFEKTNEQILDTQEIVEESLSLEDNEKELIKRALNKHEGKRKGTAQELGISERTLYRKLKEYDLE
jgi:transcriptional regulator with PAS, ATPase and Fis domain